MDIKLGDLVYSQGHCGMIIDIQRHAGEYGYDFYYKIEWYYTTNYTETYAFWQTRGWRLNFLDYYGQLKDR